MNRHSIWGFLAIGFALWGSCYTCYHVGILARSAPLLVTVVVALALAFDFTNGIHDAANSIATVVSTRVLTPLQAVVWAAFFNFVAAYVFSTHVAMTIGKGVVHPEVVDTLMILSGLLGAILWNLTTWYLGLPTSSSHALIGGLAGAAIAKSGLGAIIVTGILKIAAFIVLSPLIGLVLGFVTGVAMTWMFRNSTPRRVDFLFRKGQLCSAALYRLGHGTNDAQKTMGIIAMLLTAAGLQTYAQPTHGGWFEHFNLFSRSHNVAPWIILSCNGAIALGTMFGGWRIVKTMGSSITRLQPVGGFCAETAAATTIIAATRWGIPISTTHAITGAILGVGTTTGIRSVRWIWGQRIVLAWVLTIPCSAFMAAVMWIIVHFTVEPLFGVIGK
jgi:PiT family inorganic phosphate transporter